MKDNKRLITTDELISLKILKTVSNTTNYNILKMLPSNIKNIMEVTGLTKVPVNNHLKQLEHCKLVMRFRGTGEVKITVFGNNMMLCIQSIAKNVSDEEICYGCNNVISKCTGQFGLCRK